MKPKTNISLSILSIILIVLSFQAIASFAGEDQKLITLSSCKNLFVNVTAIDTIDTGEYSLINCTEIATNYWFCDCTDNYDLYLSTQINTLNNYTFNLTYYSASTGTTTQTVSRSS